MKIYVGSSWKNAEKLDEVHDLLRKLGHETWDFRKNGFWWEDVDLLYKADPWVFLFAPQSQSAFAYDKKGLDWCDAGLFILPAGISTALEAGYIAGQGKPAVTWGPPREPRMDIMWRLCETRFGNVPFSHVADFMSRIALPPR